MGCASSRPQITADEPCQSKIRQPQLQPRSSGSRQQGSADAAADGAGTPAATARRSSSCKSPSMDSARHNSGHLTSSGLPCHGGAGIAGSAPAITPTKSPAREQHGDQHAALKTAVDAAAAAELLVTAGSRGAGDIAAVLARVLNTAAATIALPTADCTRPGGSFLENAAASLARDLVQRRKHLPDSRHEVVVIMDLAEDMRMRGSPYVNGQLASLRFFAGAPLLSSEGQLLGTLCVCDTEARQFGAEACLLLANCAEVAARQLEARDSASQDCSAYGTGPWHRRPHRSGRDGGSRRASTECGGALPPLAQRPALLPAFSAPIMQQQQQQQQQQQPGPQLPSPLLHLKHDVTAGGIAAKRFSFEPSGGGSRASSRSASFACSQEGSLSRTSGPCNFDAAAAAAVSAIGVSATPCGPPVASVSSGAGDTSSGGHAASALNSLLYTSSIIARVSPTGAPTQSCSADHGGSNGGQNHTTADSSTLLGSAAPLEQPGMHAAAGGEAIKPSSSERPQLPGPGFRSNTANPGCHEVKHGKSPAAADAAAGAAAGAVVPSRPGPPPSRSAQLDLEPLPRISSGEPQAPPALVSAFATEAVQRPAFDDADIDAKISAAANAAARLAARAASSGGPLPPSWRGPPTCPGASAARSASSGLERSCWDPSSVDSTGGRPAPAQRAASLPPPGAGGDDDLPLNPGYVGVRPSASMNAFAAASCSRRGSAGASRLGPRPSESPTEPLCSRSSSDLADELSAELGLAPAAAGSSSGSGFRRAAGAASRGVALIDASLVGWRLLFVNEAFALATGVPPKAGGIFWQHFELPGAQGPAAAEPWRQFGGRISRGASFGMTAAAAEPSPDRPRTLKLRLSPASRRPLDEDAAAILLPTAGFATAIVAEAVPPGLYFVTIQPADKPHGRNSFDLGSSGRLSSGGSGGWDALPSSRSLSLRSDASLSLTPFDDVRLGGLLGKGSFGSVFIGWRGDQEIAVKVIHHTGVTGEANAKELEATLGLRLEHPHIVRTFDYATRSSGLAAASFKRAASRLASRSLNERRPGGSARSSADAMPARARQHETWILLELCNAGSLQSVNNEGRLRVPAAGAVTHLDDPAPLGDAPPSPAPDMRGLMACAVEIAEAMCYLHSRGMMHGDLTCNNVLLSEEKTDPRGFRIKVSDFGLSRAMHTESSLSTNTFGTVTHMPPELLSEGRLSKAADVYSFGVMLWEMYCMQRPWAGLRPIQVIMKKASGTSTLEWPPGTPALYKELAQECMFNEPEARPIFAEAAERCRDMAIAAAAGQLVAGAAPRATAGDDDSGRDLRKLPTL